MQEPQQIVSTIPSLFTSSDLADKIEGSYDVLVCGGTLGIFIATALCARGLRVAIVERNVLKGVILAALKTVNQIFLAIQLVFEWLFCCFDH